MVKLTIGKDAVILHNSIYYYLLQWQKTCICFLFGCIFQLIGVDSSLCDDKTFEVNSTADFLKTIKEIQDSPSQGNCYVIEFGQNDFKFELNETLDVSVNMTLRGLGAIITCSYPPRMFNYSAIIRVTNVKYFGISGMTFLECPSSLYFDNVTSVSINDSHFRCPLITA